MISLKGPPLSARRPRPNNAASRLVGGLVFLVMVVVVVVANVSVLQVVQAQQQETTGTDLGGGVVTRADVEYLADLTLDVRDMEQLQASGNSNAALQIYLDGKNSERQVGVRYSLTQLSTELSSSMPIDRDTTPPYLFHLYGLAERSTDLNKLADYAGYADSFVRTAIQNGHVTSATATLVLNVWMYAAHILYKGMETCQKKTEADNPSQFPLNGNGGLDDFIGLWIGTGQTHGSSNGYGLYALAERADRLFTVAEDDSNVSRRRRRRTQDTVAGGALEESAVNQQLKLLYQEGASIFSLPDVCTSGNADSPKKLWSVVTRMTTQMYVPLIQMLIVSILEQDILATDTYAEALIPQVAQCRPSIYNRLREELLMGDPNFQRTEFMLMDLQDVYSCFGVTCDDIGEVIKGYDGVNIPLCTAAQNDAPMALYRPTTDVHPIARSDLDVLHLRILTSLGSFNFAKLWYLYGRNSPRQRDSDNDPYSFYSLSEFAVSSSRRNAEPYYSAFVSYHNDPNYADSLIRDTLSGVGKWDASKSVEQRSAVITEASAFLVLYMHLMAQINDAVNNCRAVDQDGEYDLTHPWDEVAALLIGSLEGMDEGGSVDVQDGQLVWGLGTRRGFQFQTLNSQGYAHVNSDLEDLLFAGRGELDALECDMLEKTAEKVKSLTLIPLMQSILKYAIQNEQRSADSTSADLALGEVFAMSLIPIVQIYDQASAEILEENMIVRPGIAPTRDGAQVVADALGTAATAMGLKPSQLGSTPQANPCQLYGCSSAWGYGKMVLLPTIVAATLSVFCLLL